MTTEAQIGWGAELWIDNSSGTLTRVAEVTSIVPPDPVTAEQEATHFASPNRRREYIAGLIEDGTATFGINYKPSSATSTLIQEAQDSGTTRDYKIVLPDGTGTWEITGSLIVKGFKRTIPIDDKMTAEIDVRFTGAKTEAAGA
jgi:predicted secreted protein